MDPIILDALRLALQRRRYDFGGQVEWAAPKEPEPVRQPDEEEQQKFLKEQLAGSAPQYEPEAGLKTAKEAGLMAAGFVPGSGIASAAGKFPTAEGGFEPSMREDISAGRYGSAALKGLGAAGDVLQAVPVVGTAAGAALKAPLAMKLATAMAPAARLAREAAPAAEAAREAVPAAREAEAATSVAGEVSITPEMTKSQSQAAMKAAWEAGTGDTSKYKNWQHQWNVEQGPQFKAQPAETAPAPAEAPVPAAEPDAPTYQRLINPAGFYSRAHEAAMLELPAEPRPWKEMHALLSKAPRVQAEELYWSGIHPEAFPAGEKVSREQIADLIEKNFPQVHPEIRKEGAEVRPKYGQYTVPGGTDYEERILKHEYRSGDEYGANYVHPEVKKMYAPQMEEINAERRRLADEAQKARFEYKENVVRPYIENMREKYVQKLLSGDTPVTTPEELAAARAARDAAVMERVQAATEYAKTSNKPTSAENIQDWRNQVELSQEKLRQANKNYEDSHTRYYELLANSEEGVRDDVSRLAPEIIANTLGKRAELQGVKLGQSEQMANIDALYQEQEKRLTDIRDKILQESQARVPYAPEYTQQKYVHSHWPGAKNPVVHTRNSTRVGPEGEKIWHQEEMQSDWAQEGREKGFRDPKIDEAHKQYEAQRNQLVSDRDAMIDENHKNYKTSLEALKKKTDENISQAWDESFAKEQAIGGDIPANADKINAIRQEVVDKVTQLKAAYSYDEKELQNSYHQKSEEIGGIISQKLAELNANKPAGKSGPIPAAPYTRDTEHWLTLAAKDTLKEAIERGYDKIFITGGEEQARRWANELRKSVDSVSWHGPEKLRDDYAARIYGKGTYYHDLPTSSKRNVDETIGNKKTVYARPSGGGNEHRFVVEPQEGPGGKSRYVVVDSDISDAKGESLSAVIGGDLAKRVIAEESGDVPMKGYVMGSEGYSQTYERKAPSIYKKLIKSFDPEAKIEAGELPRANVTARDLQSVQDDLLLDVLDDAGGDYADQWRNQLDEMYTYMNRNRMSFDDAARLVGADGALVDIVKSAVANQPGVKGTYIQITPRMRAEYNRLKKKFGSVFPAYKQGGRVGYAVGGPSEADQEEFLREQLEGSAPQYDPQAGMRTAKEAGLMAAGLIPGTGLAAAAGKFPTTEGGFEPSLKEDIQSGNYLSAGLKGLGAAGDVLQAVPVVGTAAGAALKAPLAAKLAMAMTPAARKAAKIAREARAGNEVKESVSLAKKILDKEPPAIGYNGDPELKTVAPALEGGQFPAGPLQGPVKYIGETPQEALKSVPFVTNEMLTGKSYYPIFADLTSAGKQFEGIDSSTLQNAINTYGGPLYPLINANQIANLGWAVRGKNRGTLKVSKPADYAVVLAMSPETHKSNTTFGNALIQTMEAYGRDQRLSPENLSAINDLVRSPGSQKELAKLKEFPGFESPEAAPFIDALSFEARKKLSETLSSAKAQELGAPNMTKLIRELTEPQYHGYNRHDALMLLELAKDRDEGLVDLTNAGLPPHPDYPYGFHGRVVGQFPAGVSGRTLFPDYFTKLDAEIEAKQEAAKKAGKTARVSPERAFELALPIQEKLSEEAAAQIPLERMNIQSPKAAKLALNAANDAWQDSATAVNKGGLSTAQFARALRDSDYSSTLTPYTAEELNGKIREGKFEGYKLKDGEVYFGLEPNKDYKAEYGFEHEALGPNEKALVSVINNEPGAAGVGGPAVMYKALERGATVLDAYAVPSAAHPKGFLPQYYNKFGFEELGRIRFDPQYVSPQQFEDMKRVWRKDGWDEKAGFPDLVIMKWRGNDADRTGGLQRFVQSRSERTGQRSNIAAAAGAAEPARRNARRPAGAARGEPEVTVERGNQGRLPNGRPASPADKLARTLSETFRMSEPQAKSWGLGHEDMLAVRKRLLGYESGGEVNAALRATAGRQSRR